MVLEYIGLFVVFGILGWIADTAYRSVIRKRYFSGTLFPFFAPIYGFGGVGLVLLYTYVPVHPLVQILLGGALSTLVEYLGGVFCVKVLGRRLWDYSGHRWHYEGHISALHAFYWVLASALVRVVFPYLPL